MFDSRSLSDNRDITGSRDDLERKRRYSTGVCMCICVCVLEL